MRRVRTVEKLILPPDMPRERAAVELTRFLVHKHYEENDFLADESLFDGVFHWLGAAEQEYAVGRERVLGIFRQFEGKVPRCVVTDEEYNSDMVSEDVCVVSGRMWISTDPATGVYLRVHQRITTCVRWREGRASCCLLHISNPYQEMEREDVGFPTKMARQSREYMSQLLEEQREKLASKSDELEDIYNTVSCGIIRLTRQAGRYSLVTFNRPLAEQLDTPAEEIPALDWSRGHSPFLQGQDALVLERALERLREPGDMTNVDYTIRTASGRVMHVNSSNKLLSREGGREVIQRLTYDVTVRVELEQALKRLSYSDALTQVNNRNKFNEDVNAVLGRTPPSLGVACFDINGLKEWNDQFGHTAGDSLIKRAAANIKTQFPQETYRIGGDEFVVLDRRSTRERFLSLVDAVMEAMARDGISISAGTCWRGSAINVWEQYEEADKDMYREKESFYRQKDWEGSPRRGREWRICVVRTDNTVEDEGRR